MKWRPLDGKHRDRIEILRDMPAHELLGIAADASAQEIKQAYRRKARAYHPDRLDPFLRPHGEEIMRLLNRAYEVMLARFQR